MSHTKISNLSLGITGDPLYVYRVWPVIKQYNIMVH